MSSTKLIIVDDNQMFKVAISCFLNSQEEFEVVAQAADGEEAVRKCLEYDADIIILDINLPVIDGAEVAKIVLSNKPKSKILALTWKDDRANVLKAVKCGVLGYVLKDTSSEELIFAIRALEKGNSYFSKGVSRKILDELDMRTEVNSISNNKIKNVTPREMQILKFIADELTNKEIAEELFISPRTVETHRRNMIQKLKVKNTVGLVKYYLRIHKLQDRNFV